MTLSLEQVSVELAREKILSSISFRLEKGAIYALIGHNGAGKSTVMKTIMGWQEKKDGRILIDEVDQDRQFADFKRKLSYIPEEPFLLSELTAMQHFQLYGQSYHIEEAVLNERVKRYAEKFEIEDKLNEYPESLSKGMRQKVQTICALLPDVPVLLVDEPFMGLDIYAADYLEYLLLEKARKGTTILLTSHQLDRMRQLADYFIMLKHGRIDQQGLMKDFEGLSRRFYHE
ncbi:ABC transporter ATP-binding protein [Saliterribacillus persicus]|uniref:ABC-2 type transport system ATP-binding protein n=1 Tax=Saliterribacillus persicus TaxID=930114 RepID=A0A368XYV5_9BACI|nr:ABC transporter ATP-binding protein [Saliterribacillus persicus]RCW73045.1 ABC-2 type transport system ATP-binding protein [Saliterribacillus persicus]